MYVFFFAQPMFVDMKVGTFCFSWCMFFFLLMLVNMKVGTFFFRYVFVSAGVRRYEGGHILFSMYVFYSAGVRRYEGGHTLFSVCFWFSRCSSIRRWAHFILFSM